jgi:hypothetical protein
LRQRTPYWDLFENLPVSRKLADYATPAEVQAVIVVLKALYVEEGRKLREVWRSATSLARQPEETNHDYARHFYEEMTEAERTSSPRVNCRTMRSIRLACCIPCRAGYKVGV